MTARLLEEYKTRVTPALKEKLGVTNAHAVPRLTKIVISMGVGQAIQDRKMLESVSANLTQLAGQKSQVTRARKSIAGFKLREEMEVGCMVTLRGQRMYDFLERLICLALPRVRDFRGLNPKAFDGRGNYSLGLNEQLVFPEVDPDKAPYTQGMNITVVTTARTNDEGYALLKEIGMPFRDKK
jgi:large subunit ribosomal protein L5